MTHSQTLDDNLGAADIGVFSSRFAKTDFFLLDCNLAAARNY